MPLTGDLTQKPRKYQVIWERIKQHRKCIIEVSPLIRARVQKAVIKEKDQDLVFKMLNDIDKPRLCIHYDPAKRQMTFELKQTLGIMELRT